MMQDKMMQMMQKNNLGSSGLSSGGNELKVKVALVAALLALTFVYLMRSPLFFLHSGVPGGDSCIFKTVALYMDRGFMPYKDTFDHKGPLIYIYNWIGLHISYLRGVWFVQFVSLFCALVATYKTARLFCDRLSAFLAVAVFAAHLMSYHVLEENFTEEYALPFIALSFYIFIDYFLFERVSRKRLCASGFCFAAVLLLRPNMVTLWAVFCIAVLVNELKQKSFAQLATFLLFFLIGAAIIMVPILVWLCVNGAFFAMIRDSIVFNMKYSSATTAAVAGRLVAMLHFARHPLVLLSLVCALWLLIKRRDIFHIAYFTCLVASLIFLSMSGRIFEHYALVLIPLVTYTTAKILVRLHGFKKAKYVVAILCYLLIVRSMIPLRQICNSVLGTHFDDSHREKGLSEIAAAKEISQIIAERTSEDDRITVFGNFDVIYVLSKRLSASRYSYQTRMDISQQIQDEYFEDLEQTPPAAIVLPENIKQIGGGITEGKIGYEQMTSFIETHGYVLLKEVDGNKVYVPQRD